MQSPFNYISLFICFCFSFLQNSNAQSIDCTWAHAFGGPEVDLGWTIIADPSGNGDVYATGFFNGTVDFDPTDGEYLLTSVVQDGVYVLKLNASGSLIWAKALPGIAEIFSRGKTVAVDGNGDVYVTGSFTGLADFDPGPGTFYKHSNGSRDVFVVKLNSGGDFIWARTIGNAERGSGTSIAVNPGDGSVYIAGDFKGTVDFDAGQDTFLLTSMQYSDIFISKMDAHGNFIWAKAFHGQSFEDIYSITVDPSGNGSVYLTGDFYDTMDFDPDPDNEFILDGGYYSIGFISKLDGEGNFVWAKSLSGEYNAVISIAIDPGGSGDVYAMGNFSGIVDFDPGESVLNLEGFGVFISKLDSLGNFGWVRAITGAEDSLAGLSMVIEANENKIHFAGGFYETVDFDSGAETFDVTSSGDIDLFVSTLDFAGNFLGVSTFGGTRGEFPLSIALDPASGSLLMTGIFEGPLLPLGSVNLTVQDSSESIFIASFDLKTSVENAATPVKSIHIYPNPASESLSLAIENINSAPVNIIVYNILGEVVLKQAEEFSADVITLNIENLTPGIYLISCNNDGIRYAGKFVKQIPE